jgi:hypothetical protein
VEETLLGPSLLATPKSPLLAVPGGFQLILNAKTNTVTAHLIAPTLMWTDATAQALSSPAGLSALTALQTLDLSHCSKLQELPLSIADLTALNKLDLDDCPALYTPPRHVVDRGPPQLTPSPVKQVLLLRSTKLLVQLA